MRKVKELLEAKIRYSLKSLIRNLKPYQRIEIISRVKECDSAVNSLKKRQEGRIFDKERKYTITDLHDLAVVRVLFFPRNIHENIENKTKEFLNWTPDPIKHNDSEKTLVSKYYGYIDRKRTIQAEFQIVPMLIGLFWEVEHFAFYKPHTDYKNVVESIEMNESYQNVLSSLEVFQKIFEKILLQSS